jgi:hypothetical protein
MYPKAVALVMAGLLWSCAVECRTIVRFRDGSLYDESATLSQRGVFRPEGVPQVKKGQDPTIIAQPPSEKTEQ